MFVKIAELFIPKNYEEIKPQVDFLSRFLLIVGSLSLIPTLFLGDISLDIVKSEMRNITLAYQHEELAHNALYIFIAALVIDLIPVIKKIPGKYIKLHTVILLTTIIFGNYYIFKTAHSGASLVYDYGTAVEIKTHD
jgi:hypothetical protein